MVSAEGARPVWAESLRQKDRADRVSTVWLGDGANAAGLGTFLSVVRTVGPLPGPVFFALFRAEVEKES